MDPVAPPRSTDAPRGRSVAELARIVGCVVGAPAVVTAALLVADPAWPVWAIAMAAAPAAAAVVTVRLVLEPLGIAIAHADARTLAVESELVAERAERDMRERLDRALRSAEGEPATLRVGLRAAAELAPEHDVALLLAQTDEPKVGWSVRLADGSLDQAVPVPSAPGCRALSEGKAVVTTSSSALDACSHLQESGLEVSAACVPLRTGERILGAVCLQGPPGDRLDDGALARLEWAVDRTGTRVAEQRLGRGPAMVGRADPLTGLPGTAALRNHLRELVRTLSPFCVAIVDVDRYDDFETDEGADRALCLTAEALCSTLRPDDLICRLDGARFAAVLGSCTAEQAAAALERSRESLVLLLAADADPLHTTFSGGVVESHQATSLAELVDLAAGACGDAADAGGNRIAAAVGGRTATS